MLSVWDYVHMLAAGDPLPNPLHYVSSSKMLQISNLFDDELFPPPSCLAEVSCVLLADVPTAEASDSTLIFGNFDELVEATIATNNNWITKKNLTRDFNAFSNTTLSLSLWLQIQDDDGIGLRKDSLFVSLELFAKYLLSKLAQSNFTSKKRRAEGNVLTFENDSSLCDPQKVSEFVSAILSCSHLRETKTLCKKVGTRKVSLSSIRSHCKQEVSVPVKDVIITDDCRSTIKQALLEGLSYALVPADTEAPLLFLMNAANFDLTKFKRQFGELDTTHAMISRSDRSSVVRPHVKMVQKPIRLKSQRAWSSTEFHDRIIKIGLDRMLMTVIVVPPSPSDKYCVSQPDCPLTYGLKNSVWSSMRGLKAMESVLRVKSAFSEFCLYTPKSGDFSNLLWSFIKDKFVHSLANSHKFKLCDKKFPQVDYTNPPYPTIIIILGGGQHGVIRINLSFDLQQKCKYIDTLIFETLAKIYLGSLASSLVSVPINTILHPIENVDGDFSMHVCTKRNFGYCTF